MTVTVYSKPLCPQCDATKRRLTKLGVPFTPIDITEDADAFKYVQVLGYEAVPVVEYKGDHWYGYRPDKLQSLANARKDAA